MREIFTLEGMDVSHRLVVGVVKNIFLVFKRGYFPAQVTKEDVSVASDIFEQLMLCVLIKHGFLLWHVKSHRGLVMG